MRVLSRVFRGKFVALLKQAYRQGQLDFHGQLASLVDPAAFERLLNTAVASEWVVYCKPPFGGPEQVLKYLARYTHRVAISNSRLVDIDDGQVRFRWKNYARGNQWSTMSLPAEEFIRRFLMHVLPSGLRPHSPLRLALQPATDGRSRAVPPIARRDRHAGGAHRHSRRVDRLLSRRRQPATKGITSRPPRSRVLIAVSRPSASWKRFCQAAEVPTCDDPFKSLPRVTAPSGCAERSAMTGIVSTNRPSNSLSPIGSPAVGMRRAPANPGDQRNTDEKTSAETLQSGSRRGNLQPQLPSHRPRSAQPGQLNPHSNAPTRFSSTRCIRSANNIQRGF